MRKQGIKNRLSAALRAKFADYAPESAYMPFHTRLLGKDRMALYSFIQSLNTNFGTSIFEPVAEEFWDFLGGDGSYTMILEAFEEVGKEMREKIDEYFKRFNRQL